MYGKANVVCKLLPDILRRILKQKWYTPADCLIFEQLKQEAEKYHPELWYEIQSICFPQTNGPIKTWNNTYALHGCKNSILAK